MKQIAIAILLALGLALNACGGGFIAVSAVDGNWTATLISTDGAPAFGFTSSFIQNDGSSTIIITSLRFTPATPCFSSPTNQTGAFVLGGNSSGTMAGSFAMTVSTTFSTAQNNVLTLQGSENGNTISGTWMLTGMQSGCTGSGNFTLTRL